MALRMKNLVTQVPTEPAERALAHFEARLAHETDCWDVHAAQSLDERGFVLLDVRSPEAYARGHLPGALNIPQAQINAERLADFPADTLFVTYCAGTHCNGSTRAAIALARLGRPVKEMPGGALGWVDEGFSLVSEA